MKKLNLALAAATVFLFIGNSNAQGNSNGNGKRLVTDVEEGVTYLTGNIVELPAGGLMIEPNPLEIILDHVSQGMLTRTGIRIVRGPKKIVENSSTGAAGKVCYNTNSWPCMIVSSKE